MKIVIDVPDRIYKRQGYLNIIDSDILRNALKNGIPLPKGHGRLIEVNKLLNMTKSYKSELGGLKADPFVKSGIETVESFIKELPTIIEADKEREE